MNKNSVIQTLETQLHAVQAERQAAQRDPALRAARAALKRHQAARLAATHADLLAAPRTRPAAQFFLDELYGTADATQRDVDLERIIPTLQRLLPPHPLETITHAIVLDALSERLDTAMALRLGLDFTEQDYAAAYRSVATRAEREQQLALIETLGDSLCQLVRIPFLAMTLKFMHGPALLAGLGQLQHFLETGFGSFKQLPNAADFVHTIVARERGLLERLYAQGEQHGAT